jgi:RNA-directed DNA polymerase
MDDSTVIKTLAISEKAKVHAWYYMNHGCFIHPSLGHFRNHELNALLLLSIEQPVELCKFLKTPLIHLEQIINNPSYQFFTIPKKQGGAREILAPDEELKKIQKHLNYYLQAWYLCIKPAEVHGFVIHPHYLEEYCNIVANASIHVGKKHLLNLDLKDFFPGISAKRVRDLFRSDLFGFSDQIATAMTLLTTYKGTLPIGAPTSPVISNFICLQLDADLISYCENHHLSYSRYADDLTFSSNEVITPEITGELINLIQLNNFAVNSRKTRLTSFNRRQSVTGLTVNEKVNIDRKLLKKIRAMLHDLSVNGITSATRNHFSINGDVQPEMMEKFHHKLAGYINFVGQVRGRSDALFIKFRNLHEVKN